jgi:hypothetical protein
MMTPTLNCAGVYAGIQIEGNAADLTLVGSVDLCGEIAGIQVCGASIYSGLPIVIVNGSFNFEGVCGPTPAPPPPVPTPVPPPCADYPPDQTNSCAQQKEWGKCGEPWMQGFCCATCFNCQGNGCCVDTPPDPRYSCAEQHSWDKCTETWMQGYCCSTCFNCQGNGCGGIM